MDPSQLPVGYAWNTVNMINIAGVPSCRPGHRCLVKLPKGNLQGSAIFRPQIGLEQILIAIDGVVYVATWPFLEFNFLPNVQFLPSAKQLFFTQTLQAAQRTTPGSLTSAIEVILPRSVMFMQDGGSTAPAWYDGSNSGHIRDLPFQTPAGGPMEWVGDRLWVAVGSQVLASDISNPFSFVEQVYLGGTVGFNFSRDVTALTKTPSVISPQLLVYTDEDTSLIQADLRDRSQWPTTLGFQREILQVGCASDRAVTSHFGRLLWFSSSGLVIYDMATAQTWTSRTPLRDNEMLVSKTGVSGDLSLVSMGVFGQWVLISVPAEDIYNKHTWVLNNASFETVGDEGGPSWSGYWLGTRPVEWIYGVIAGKERIFHVSTDSDGENRLWESFTPDRLDNGCPIMWAMETRGYFGLSSQAKKLPGARVQFAFADVALTAISEDLDFGVFVAPGVRGEYHQIMSKRISAQKGSLIYNQPLTATTKVFAYKPQTRTERTEDYSEQNPDVESGSCPPESDKNDDTEESFQLLIVGHGPAAIRWIRAFSVMKTEEDYAGNNEACENEQAFNIIRFDGAGVFDTDLPAATELIALRAVRDYTSTKTATVTAGGLQAVGVGSSESIVSQEAADRVAERIAVRQAEVELVQTLPTILSVGKGFDE